MLSSRFSELVRPTTHTSVTARFIHSWGRAVTLTPETIKIVAASDLADQLQDGPQAPAIVVEAHQGHQRRAQQDAAQLLNLKAIAQQQQRQQTGDDDRRAAQQRHGLRMYFARIGMIHHAQVRRDPARHGRGGESNQQRSDKDQNGDDHGSSPHYRDDDSGESDALTLARRYDGYCCGGWKGSVLVVRRG